MTNIVDIEASCVRSGLYVYSTLEAVGIAATGIVLDSTHSWALMFELLAGLHVTGGLFFALFADSRPRFGDAKHAEDAEQSSRE